MRRSSANLLLVEGKGEERVIPYLMDARGVAWGSKPDAWPVTIEACDGIERLLAPPLIETYLDASGLRRLGIVVDADDGDAARNFERVRRRCIPRFPGLLDELPTSGVVTSNAAGQRLSVWVMPDCRSRGMLETLLTFLAPAGPLLAHAEQACTAAKAHGAPFRPNHTDKARIHAWLAWQDPPGQQLHGAVMQRILDPSSPHADAFVAWFRELFEL